MIIGLGIGVGYPQASEGEPTVPYAPTIPEVFGDDLAFLLRSDVGVTVTGLGASAWVDQGADGHDAAQGTDASRPPYASNILSPDGAADHMILAAGAGWPAAARTSHSIFALVNPQVAAGTLKHLIDFGGAQRLILSARSQTAGKIGWFDGTWRELDAPTTGWQILEWHLDATATSGEMIRTGASASVSLGTATYSPRNLSATTPVAVFSSATGGSAHLDCESGVIVMISRATGHAIGVTSADERAKARDDLRSIAATIGATLA